MTPFAKLSRQYRKDRGLLLGDVADKLGCSASYLSQVESNNRPIPDGFVGRLTAALSLSEREAGALERAAAMSAKDFRFTVPVDAQAQDRKILHTLSVGFARMSPAKKQRLLHFLQEDANV